MSANPTGSEQPIIVKKKKPAHGGAHGGAWKVAYADFVTAMMAFFLLLWLLNVTTSDQRKGIADYFAPVSVSRESSGSGGMLGGRSMSEPGASMSPSAPLASENSPSGGAAGGGSEDEGGVNDPPQPKSSDPRPKEARFEQQQRLEQTAKQLGVPGQKPGERLSDFAERVEEAGDKMQTTQREAKQFQQAAADIRQAIQSTPELQPLAQNMVIDQTPDGLRIQIVDQERLSMFPGGSSQMYGETRQLMMAVGKALAKLPNKVSVSGHTDSSPFAPGAARDNWDLSTERANTTRRALVAGGVPEGRIQEVTGHADRDLMMPDEPNSPRNRRISIVLLRETAQRGAAP
jgi:chemotaxis protein MotB